eukprot:CAMPEP_0117616724 /NCGR_PEP_ID=MMETSP0784-20121206/85211_1 /TAXON_ID=39447 /ORGANISM="" /LENGTH=454 /DNA_ID=CAMNT_0005420517 /DNA_START=125 /DNA_END=1489 /DNA_ORIENTATION=-
MSFVRRADRDLSDMIKMCFRKFDGDGNGYISKIELQRVLVSLSCKSRVVSTEEIEMCMAAADLNKNGVIEYNEFVDWLMTPGALAQPCRTNGVGLFDLAEVMAPLFKVFDKNGDGLVQEVEFAECWAILKNAIALSQTRMSNAPDPKIMDDDAEDMFQTIDSDRSRSLNFEEFVDWQRRALEKSGLMGEDLKDLVPALARQLSRVFRLSASDEKGELTDDDRNTLVKVIDNLASFSRDLWNEERAAQNSLYGRHHFTNRWSEPPNGLNVRQLRCRHLRNDFDLQVLCVPESIEQMTGPIRRWLARVCQRTPWNKRKIEEGRYYVFRQLHWEESESLGKEFRKALMSFSVDLRFYCLLKTEADFANEISWMGIQDALKSGIEYSLFTLEQHIQFNEHMEQEFLQALEGADSERGGEVQLEKLRASIKLPLRSVVATLVELEVLNSSSKLADCVDA